MTCRISLYHEQLDKTLFRKYITSRTPRRVDGSLYWAAIEDLQTRFDFKYLGHYLAVLLGKSIETSKLVGELLYSGSRRSKSWQLLSSVNWTPEKPYEKAELAIINSLWDECIQIGQPAVNPLIKTLETSSVNKAKVAWVLGEIGDDRAVKPLLDYVQSNRWYKPDKTELQIIMALGKLKDDKALGYLEKNFNHKNKKIAEAAHQAIEQFHCK